MTKNTLHIFGYVVGICIIFLIKLTVLVVAQDGGGTGDGGDLGDVSEGLAIAGIVLYALSAVVGIAIFLSIRPHFIKFFKKMKLKMKTLIRIHHPLTIATILVWIGHGLPIISSSTEVSSTGLMIPWVTILLYTTGFLFPLMKGFTRRKILRYIHLSLMIIVAIFIGIHVASGDL